MEPHQKHYRAKMRRNGWMDAEGKMVWPEDADKRQKMARNLIGLELVSDVDYWLLLAEDEIDDTHQAPWEKPDKKQQPEIVRRREILRTLNHEQREAVRGLLRYAVKGELYSFCLAIDRTLGGSTLSVNAPLPNSEEKERVEIHTPDQDEWIYEHHQWLKDFSILFGKDERFGADGSSGA